MLSIVITASDDPKALARLLTALVPAAADGLVSDVVVRGAEGISRELADDAGATLVGGDDFPQAIALARGQWVAGLPLYAILTLGWMEVVAQHMAREPSAPARLIPSAGLLRPAKMEGWLVPKALAASASVVEHDLQRLTRRGGVSRLRVLAGR